MSPQGRRRASLRGLLTRMVVALAVVLGVLIAAALFGSLNTARDYRDASERGIERQAAVNRYFINMLNAQSANRAYILLARGTDQAAWSQARDRYGPLLAALRTQLRGEPELLASADAVDRMAQLWFREAVELIRLRRVGRREEAALRVDTGPGEERFEAFRREQVLLLDQVSATRLAEQAANDRNLRITLGIIVGAALLALVMVAIISRNLWRRVGVPVALVHEGVGRVAEGRLSDPVRAPDDAVREIADLATGFNQMQTEVRQEREAVAASARREAAQQTERELWETVQQGLLPSRLPAVSGFRLAARYRPADRALLVGGDFYDAMALPGGRIAAMVGDISGHGASAAAQAAGLRFGWRTLVAVDPDPGAVLAGLNAQMATRELRAEGMFASIIYVVIEPNGEMRFASAGHPPAFLLTPRICAPLTPVKVGPLLGVLDRAEWFVTHAEFPLGSTIVLYTDGLVEARRGADLFGAERACKVLAAERASALELRVRRLIAAARRHEDERLRDDVAVLAIERPRPLG